jgi:carbon-monoxide dehydrogenase catalytic subunit
VAIEVFGRRKNKPVDIPDIENTLIAGFSVESIVAALAKLDAQDPLKPLVDNIKNGNIRGVCLFAGCNNVKVAQDKNYKIMAQRLLKENVLVVATGCGAGALMRHGFMDPANVDILCYIISNQYPPQRRRERRGVVFSIAAERAAIENPQTLRGENCISFVLL